MDRELPKSGELWQHFKEHRYWIIGIASDVCYVKSERKYVIYVENWIEILIELFSESDFIVRDSENEYKYYYVKFRDNKWILLPATLDNGDYSLGWARPLEMFMDNLDDSRGGGFRFTKLDLETICLKQK